VAGESPVASPKRKERQRNKGKKWIENGRPKGTVKSRMAKNGNGNKKKKKQICFDTSIKIYNKY
jgi:hypothetical protein